jgi:hypothetical protein
LFNININKAARERKQTARNDIQLTSGKKIQTVLYADDQVILAKSNEELQINGNGKLMRKYYMKIPLPKQKQCDYVWGKNI